MSLSAKIAAILTALIVVFSTIGAVAQNRVFGGIFEDIETAEAADDLARVTGALDAAVDEVGRIAQRISRRPSAVDYIAGKNADEFYADNLDPALLRSEGIDVLYYCDLDGRVVGGTVLDAETGAPGSLRKFPTGALGPRHPALAWYDARGEVKVSDLSDGRRQRGIMMTESAPLIVGAAIIANLDSPDRHKGIVVVGRYLAGDLAERISKRTKVDFKAWQLNEDKLPPEIAELQSDVTASARPILKKEKGGGFLSVYWTVDDITGKPELLLHARVERDVTTVASSALNSGTLTTATLGLAILLGLLFTLNLVVLRPIKALTEHAVRTGKDENFRARFGTDRADEIGTLGREFDGMMGHLDQARAAVVDTARAAGMSEIATGVLHNVGNVLNSVNISAGLVAQRVEGLCVDDLERLSEVLSENAADLPRFLSDDPRGKHIQPFLTALVGQLSEEQRTIQSEVDSLSDGIEHICELIKSQQSLAKGTTLIEFTSLSERLDEALQITQRVQGVDPGLVVVRRFGDLPDLQLDRHKLLEILVNLVQNAVQAMRGVEAPRELALSIQPAGDGEIEVSVQDSGAGISPENLTRVFHMGFTTKQDGHGFGLHASANAAVEMGGSLRAESEGPGRGARFVLTLPIVPPSLAADGEPERSPEAETRGYSS